MSNLKVSRNYSGQGTNVIIDTEIKQKYREVAASLEIPSNSHFLEAIGCNPTAMPKNPITAEIIKSILQDEVEKRINQREKILEIIRSHWNEGVRLSGARAWRGRVKRGLKLPQTMTRENKTLLNIRIEEALCQFRLESKSH